MISSFYIIFSNGMFSWEEVGRRKSAFLVNLAISLVVNILQENQISKYHQMKIVPLKI